MIWRHGPPIGSGSCHERASTTSPGGAIGALLRPNERGVWFGTTPPWSPAPELIRLCLKIDRNTGQCAARFLCLERAVDSPWHAAATGEFCFVSNFERGRAQGCGSEPPPCSRPWPRNFGMGSDDLKSSNWKQFRFNPPRLNPCGSAVGESSWHQNAGGPARAQVEYFQRSNPSQGITAKGRRRQRPSMN